MNERKELIERLRMDYTASSMALSLMREAADMLEADVEPKCSDQAPQPQRPRMTDGELYTAYIEATNQTLRPQDERLAFAFARAIEKKVRGEA